MLGQANANLFSLRKPRCVHVVFWILFPVTWLIYYGSIKTVCGVSLKAVVVFLHQSALLQHISISDNLDSLFHGSDFSAHCMFSTRTTFLCILTPLKNMLGIYVYPYRFSSQQADTYDVESYIFCWKRKPWLAAKLIKIL